MIFRFRQFSITQKDSAMKVGTDSVLLGSFCDPGDAKNILDIGAGTGLLALMLAQKSAAHIDAVEPDLAAYRECVFNCEQSAWKDRLHVMHGRIQDVDANRKYDLIISNPPYYKSLHHIPIENKQRSLARHDQQLSSEVLCKQIDQRLNPDGVCWLILPVQEALAFADLIKAHGLWPKALIHVKPNPKKEVNRYIMCFTRKPVQCITTSIQLYNEKGIATAAYIQRTRDYLLWNSIENEV